MEEEEGVGIQQDTSVLGNINRNNNTIKYILSGFYWIGRGVVPTVCIFCT